MPSIRLSTRFRRGADRPLPFAATTRAVHLKMFWLILTALVIVAGFALRKKRGSYAVEREPWDAEPSPEDPLDIEEIRRAEAEWEAEEDWEDPPEEEWR